MKTVLRSLLAVVVGLAVALALVVGVEWFSAMVHPMPADLNGNIPEHVRRYPGRILGVVVLAWGGTFAVATGIASRMGNRVAGLVVGAVMACGLLFNLAMLPYALWFKIAMIMAFPLACWVGLRLGRRQVEAN